MSITIYSKMGYMTVQKKSTYRATGIYFGLTYHQDVYVILNSFFKKLKFIS